jgi:hypothetical protein
VRERRLAGEREPAIRALFIAARQARLTIQVSAAGPINETLLRVSGLDQIATIVMLDWAHADDAPGPSCPGERVQTLSRA